MSTPDSIINNIQKESKGKYGLFCLNCLIMRCNFRELNEFLEKNNIDKEIKTKTGFLRELAVYYYNVYRNVSEVQKKFKTSSDLMGYMLLKDENLKQHLPEFDFISKQEVIDIFSDYCADLGISVFNTAEISEYSIDLYLTKKKPRLKTEAVFIRTGTELENESKYQETLKAIEEASKIAIWNVFVTTPAGIYKVGLKKLIEDMERLNVWLYIVDPTHKKISGITKGKNSKDYLVNLSEDYIQKLPREPVRAPSQVIKFSKYEFKESESYKSKSFFMFELLPEQDFDKILGIPKVKRKYQNIFRNLLIIDIDSGISIFSYSSKDQSIDDNLISGFLTAMDNFVSEIGGPTSLKEINYKGFFIHAVYGQLVKMALFLSEASDQILKERLAYFLEQFEENFKEQIELFKKTGNTSYFDSSKIIRMVRENLDV